MPEFTKYRLTLSYDGTGYCGWQEQRDDPSVQEELRHAVRNLFQEEAAVHGASRTDSGVHALNQVAHFRVRNRRDPREVTSALNHHLPDDVTVHSAAEADPDFQAHVDATGKTYLYLVLNRRDPPALFQRYLHWMAAPLATEPMREVLERMEGTHPFTGFATDADDVENPTCSLRNTGMVVRDDALYVEFTGDRFLYNMVRALVGTMIDVGRGNRSPSVVNRVLESRDRSAAGPVAPAAGLYLADVYYRPLNEVTPRIEQRIRQLFPRGGPIER